MESRYRLVTVRKCSHVWEAEILCERLRSGGLQAFVQGGESNLSLSYAAVALGGVRVQVSEDDLEGAREILREDQLQQLSAGRWQCPRCGEPNEASFDLCYSCSLPRPDRVPREGEVTAARSAGPWADAVPVTKGDADAKGKVLREPAEGAAALVHRAAVAALLGCVFPMLLFQGISLWWLVRGWREGALQQPRLRFTIGWVGVVDVMIIAVISAGVTQWVF